MSNSIEMLTNDIVMLLSKRDRGKKISNKVIIFIRADSIKTHVARMKMYEEEVSLRIKMSSWAD